MSVVFPVITCMCTAAICKAVSVVRDHQEGVLRRKIPLVVGVRRLDLQCGVRVGHGWVSGR